MIGSPLKTILRTASSPVLEPSSGQRCAAQFKRQLQIEFCLGHQKGFADGTLLDQNKQNLAARHKKGTVSRRDSKLRREALGNCRSAFQDNAAFARKPKLPRS